MSYLLSIIVPTKDRYQYLKPLIQLIQSFNSCEIELIIQDNTKDNAEILHFIEKFGNNHLKYFHRTEQLSVAKNSDIAIQNSTGKYVCFIGDDDGVTGHIVSAVKWMEEKEIDVLKSTTNAYKWPSYNISKIANFSSVLMMGFYDKKYKKIDAIAELKKSLRNGGNEIALLPKLYHGIARRSTLDKIYEVGGTFFPGPSPDMANSIAMSFVAENFVCLNFPVIIPGNAVKTSGDSGKYKNQHSKLSEIPFLPEGTEKNWENFIPKVWTSQTIMPESACKAIKYMGREDYIEKYLNVEKMLAYFLIENLNLKKLAINKSSNKVLLVYFSILFFVEKVFRAIYNKIIYNLFSILYSGRSYSGGIFAKNNYFTVKRNIDDIIIANDCMMKIEPIFSTD